VNERSIRRAIAGVLVVFVFSIAADAGDTPQSVLDDAKILARSGATADAADRFGAAAVLAQKAADLVAENTISDAFVSFVDRESMAAAFPNDDAARVRPNLLRASLLATAMDHLDPARCGAFVSAPVLSRYVLQLATETGDFTWVPDAAKVAAIHGAKRGSGRGAATTAKYAAGLTCVAQKRWADAMDPLLAAFNESAESGWFDLAMHAGTELALAWWAAGDEAEAKRTLRAVGTMLEAPRPQYFFHLWIDCVKTRLPDSQHPLRKFLDGLKSLAKAYGDHESGYAGQGDGLIGEGSRGGHGGKGGVDPVSEIGALLPVMAPSGPIVTVTRTADGFEIRWSTSAGRAPVRKIDERLVSATEGGVTLTFQSASVTLRIFDPTGLRGYPTLSGTPLEPDPAQAFYLLALDEVWTVAKDGHVTIRDR
jgi:hypothetical protein